MSAKALAVQRVNGHRGNGHGADHHQADLPQADEQCEPISPLV